MINTTGISFGHRWGGRFKQNNVSKFYDPDAKKMYSPTDVKHELEKLIELKRQYASKAKRGKRRGRIDWNEFKVSSPLMQRLDKIYKPTTKSSVSDIPDRNGEYRYRHS
jgi:hypothetical protein